MKNYKIKVIRLNYEFRSEQGGYGYIFLEENNFKNIDQIYEIKIYSNDIDFLNEVQNKLPKSIKSKIEKYANLDGEKGTLIAWKFNTHFTNENTGLINETALKNRIKIINHLSQLLNIEK